MARRQRLGPMRRAWSRAGRARRYARPATRPGGWRESVDGRAPRLGPRQYIGHDIAPGRGPWKGRDPMRTPNWWLRPHWFGMVGWAVLTGTTGFLSWRRHGGREFLFGPDDD